MVLPSPTGASSFTVGSSVSDTASSSHETDSTKESTARLHQPQHESMHHTQQLSYLSLCRSIKGVKPLFWAIEEGNHVNTAALNVIDSSSSRRLAVFSRERVSGVQLEEEGPIVAATVSSDGSCLAVACHCSTAPGSSKVYLICATPSSVDIQYHKSLGSMVTALSFGKGRDIYAGTCQGEIFRIVDDSGDPIPIDCSLNGDEILSMVYSDRVLPKGLLLIATTSRVCIVRLSDTEQQPVWVGSREHHGRFGGALLDDGRVCCARPGGRIWLADINLLDDSCNYTTLSVQNTLKFSSNDGKSVSLGMLWVLTDRHVLSIASGSKQRAYLLDVETVEVAYEFMYMSQHNNCPPIVSVSTLGPQMQGVLLHIGAYSTSPSITALIKPNVIGMPPHITLLSISLLSPSPHPRSLPARLPIPTSEERSVVSGNSSSSRRSKTHSLADRHSTEDGPTSDSVEVLNLSNFPSAINTGFTGPPSPCCLRSIRHAHPSDGITSLHPPSGCTTLFISTYNWRRPVSVVGYSMSRNSYASVDRATVYQVESRARLLSLSSCLVTKHSGLSLLVEEPITPPWVIDALEADCHSLVEVKVIRDELYEAFSTLGWEAAQRAMSIADGSTATAITSRRKCDEIRWQCAALGDKYKEITQYLRLSPHVMLHPRRYMDILMDHTVPFELMVKYPPGLFPLSDGSITLSQALNSLNLSVPRQSSPGILRCMNRQDHQNANCGCLAQRVLYSLTEHNEEALTRAVKSLGAILPLFLVHAIAAADGLIPLEDIILALEVSQVPLDDETLTLLWEHAWHIRDKLEYN